MSRKVTIAQVAKEAGVSIATVSRVLNRREGNIRISEETRGSVEAAAERLGYQADPFATALRTRRSGLFGAIIRDLNDPFLIKVFVEMQRAARDKGIELLLANANFDISAAGRQANGEVEFAADFLEHGQHLFQRAGDAAVQGSDADGQGLPAAGGSRASGAGSRPGRDGTRRARPRPHAGRLA